MIFSRMRARLSGWSFFGLSGAFWVFLVASCLFTFGVFVFVLLYNLYLLDRGFREDFLGLVTSAMTAGNIVGTLFVVAATRRLGLKRLLLLCFAGMAAVSAGRALVVGQAALLGWAFLWGVTFAFWAITIPVAVAQLTSVELRPVGFSAYLASVIGIGIVADAVGGWLPGWLAPVIGTTAPVETKRAALLVGCAIAALALMNLGTGAFNPFSNAYFAQYLKMPVHDIGVVFSAGQLAQVCAILLAPLIVRRVGAVRGIMGVEVFTGLSLAFLATGPPGSMAALGFAGYLAFQWMDEPAMESLLMTQVPLAQRSGASSLMYLVIFSANAVAAPVAGTGIARFGYPVVMIAAAAFLVAGGLAFGFLLRRFEPRSH